MKFLGMGEAYKYEWIKNCVLYGLQLRLLLEPQLSPTY